MTELSIVIPAYNEEKRIKETLDSYIKYFKAMYKKNFEILIILNGCRDKTEEIVKNYREKNKDVIKYKNISRAIGKGGAIIEGFKLANSKIIGFVDADNSTNPKAFNDLAKELERYDADCVIASRWIKGAIVKPKQKLSRRIASRAFNILVKFLFSLKVNDTQCGAKIFKKEPLKEVLPSLGITKWAFDVDLLYQLKRRGKKILEIPTEWHDKKGSNLKLGKTVPEMFLGIVRLRLLYSPLNFTVKMYDRLPESVKIHHRWR